MKTKTDNRGTMIQGSSSWRINNALVEEVRTSDGRTGHLIVSYAVRNPNGLTVIETLRLNVNRNTAVIDQSGRAFCLCNIQPGMWVDTEFSSAMTRSIPPQTNAFLIVVKNRRYSPQPPQLPTPPEFPSSVTTTDRIVGVDARNNLLFTGNPFDISQQIRFVVTNETIILDIEGNPIQLRFLQPGQLVRIEHANFRTMSIPPQTTAFRIQLV